MSCDALPNLEFPAPILLSTPLPGTPDNIEQVVRAARLEGVVPNVWTRFATFAVAVFERIHRIWAAASDPHRQRRAVRQCACGLRVSNLSLWWFRLWIQIEGVDVKQVSDRIWLVTFMDYDLGRP